MPKTAKLIAVITNNKIEMEWTIANQSLAGLDSSTREVIEELVGSFNSPYADRRKWAKKALSDTESAVRANSSQAIQSIGPREEDIPHLITALADDKAVESAALILGNMGKPAKEAIPGLMKACVRPGLSREIKENLEEIRAKANKVEIEEEPLTMSGNSRRPVRKRLKR